MAVTVVPVMPACSQSVSLATQNSRTRSWMIFGMRNESGRYRICAIGSLPVFLRFAKDLPLQLGQRTSRGPTDGSQFPTVAATAEERVATV